MTDTTPVPTALLRQLAAHVPPLPATTPAPGREEVTAWLASLTPARRAAALGYLLDRRSIAALSAARAEAYWTATRTARAEDVAAEAGVAVTVVRKAVVEHNRTNRTR